jgi:hypothetical protein
MMSEEQRFREDLWKQRKLAFAVSASVVRYTAQNSQTPHQPPREAPQLLPTEPPWPWAWAKQARYCPFRPTRCSYRQREQGPSRTSGTVITSVWSSRQAQLRAFFLRKFPHSQNSSTWTWSMGRRGRFRWNCRRHLIHSTLSRWQFWSTYRERLLNSPL